jgi:hypothetical protein
LKPQAQSYSPFGTKADVRTPVRKIEATPIEDEDDDEADYDMLGQIKR